jgi:hypothetical protein
MRTVIRYKSTSPRRACFRLVVAATVALPISAVAASVQSAPAVPWKQSRVSELYASEFPTAIKVQEFINRVAVENHQEDTLSLEVKLPNILDYALLDLRGDGDVQLVCLLDYSGRGLSYYLVAVSKSGQQYRLDLLEAPGQLDKISNVAKDLNSDGKIEIIVDAPLTVGRDRSSPVPYFRHVYEYGDHGFTMADTRFRAYYRHTYLPSLEEQKLKQVREMNSLPTASRETLAYESENLNAIDGSIAATRRFLSPSQ